MCRTHSLAFLNTDIYQHTSLAAPSRCTAKYIRAYFQDGSLPAPGVVCDADLLPFEKYNMTSLQYAEQSEDAGLDFALLKLMHAPVISL